MNKFYLSFSIIGTVTYVLWGYVVTLTNPNIVVDSFTHRFLVVLPFCILVIWSVIYKKINIEYLAYVGVFLITADYCYLASLNNNLIHTTGLYVVLTASLAVIHKKWFLWIYSISFTLYCIYSFFFISNSFIEKTHWANMFTLLVLATFFGLWRIRSLDQLELEYKGSLEKSKKLEELNNIATQAAHDIRSPVMALESFVSTCSDFDSKKVKIVSDAAKRVNQIADDLLIEYRKEYSINIDSYFGEKPTVSELVELIKEEKSILQSNFRKFKINIHGEIKFLVPEVKFQLEIKRILSNIITNSIEAFENSNGMIDIILSEDQTWYTIEIKDNGVGIPSEIKDKIFERGVSFGKKTGTGLGLTAAKELIEKNRGDIRLTSKPGIGTIVQLTFNKL
jgi:signal transduction histidine kinase